MGIADAFFGLTPANQPAEIAGPSLIETGGGAIGSGALTGVAGSFLGGGGLAGGLGGAGGSSAADSSSGDLGQDFSKRLGGGGINFGGGDGLKTALIVGGVVVGVVVLLAIVRK